MSKERIERLRARTKVDVIPFCVQKARYFTEEYRRRDNEPEMIRMAMAQAYMLDHIDIYIAPDELIVGSPASREMGIEADFWNKGVWTDEGINSLREEGGWEISEEDADAMKELSAYWHPVITDYKVLDLYDEEMWRWKHSGFLLPPSKTYEQASGSGFAGNGYMICGDAADINSMDFGYVIGRGLLSYIEEAEDELASMTGDKLNTPDDFKKVEFLKAAIIIQKAIIRFSERFADLAEKQAAECGDEVRAKELRKIAENCRWAPAHRPRTFYEAIQSMWMLFLMFVNRNTTPLQRFDQYMMPYYQADVDSGNNDDEFVLELLQCLRLKFMTLKSTSGGATRKKWSGSARWNNMTLGGVKSDGTDATTPLTYLAIEAAYRCRVPHHTLTVRVHKGTPDKLMLAALKLVRTGIGMPAFVGDKSYIESMMSHGVPLEKAREYYMIGCIDPTVPEGFGNVFSMIVPPLALDTFMHNGYSPMAKEYFAPMLRDVFSIDNFDDFVEGFLEHLNYYLQFHAKDNAMRYYIGRDILPDVLTLSLYSDGLKVGKIGRYRKLPYRLGPTMDIGVGAVNIAESLYVVKKLVFEEKKITMKELIDAMDDNWESPESQRIHEMCLALPKYGNNDEEVDEMVNMIYSRMQKLVAGITSYMGIPYNSGAISITAYDPGGALVGATPDGRYAKEALADACLSPIRGQDRKGPTAVISGALRVDQKEIMSMLMNMKFHPSALKSDEDLLKLSALIRVYLENGGKQIQFNVVDKDTLIDAKEHPEYHRDLVVRVAGYSAYYVQLSKVVQDELIVRTEHEV